MPRPVAMLIGAAMAGSVMWWLAYEVVLAVAAP